MSTEIRREAASRLRVGLLLSPGNHLSAWQAAAIEHLKAGGDVDICLVVREAGTRRPGGATQHRLNLWNLYNNGWVARRSQAVRRVDAANLIPGIAELSVMPEPSGRISQRFPESALAEIARHDLQVLIRFGFGILRGDVLDAVPYGIWSFHHDDDRVVRGGPPAFWEVYERMPTTGVLLQRLTESLDAGIPLERAIFSTVSYSYPRNRDEAAFGAAALPAKVARAVRSGWLDPSVDYRPSDPLPPIRRNPTNAQMVRFLGRQSVHATLSRLQGVLVGHKWAVGVATTDDDDFSAERPEIEWLPERRAGYFADPFPARHDGVSALLVEEFDERTAKGTISAFERTERGWHLHRDVLDPGVHASYPFLLAVGEDLYCIPETAEAGRVQAWRCRRFPTDWEPGPVLVESPVLDPTIVRWGGVWWMFGTRRDRARDAELWLWSAPGPLGPWTQHPANPVKIDVRSSRPAGTPFIRGGVLYRPAQDCSQQYGSAVVINQVDRLDDTGFEEHVTRTVKFGGRRYPAGSHTLSSRDGMVAIDARRNVIDRHRSVRELRARIQRATLR